MLTREEFQVLYDQGPDAVYALCVAMHATIEAQQQQIEALSARVKELEDRLGKDSHNSSKPPSSDGLAKKPAPKSLRGKSGRRPGGQPGHRGYTLELSEHPDRTILHAPTSCRHCGASLLAAPLQDTERRQVFDLPPTALVVTEHRLQTCCCSACGQKSSGEFPAEVTHRVQYGPRVKALTTYLMHFQLLPFDRVCTLMRDLFGSSLSEGTLLLNTQEAFHALENVEAEIYRAIANARLAHFDETGVRIAGKLYWLHVSSTQDLTFYATDPRRGNGALEAIGLLPQFHGRAIHDAWSAYHGYDCLHGLCNAHHLRELIQLEERHQQTWAQQMRLLLLEMKKSVDCARQRNHLRLHPRLVYEYVGRYKAIIAQGYAANPPMERTGKSGRPKEGPVRCLLNRLQRSSTSVLAFMYDFSVPFDNNQAERDIRMMKVKQKISGCFRTPLGADAFCRIRGYISTLRKQGYDIMVALQSVFNGNPIMPALPT
jgi:transposase